MWVRLPPRAPFFLFCFQLVHALFSNLYLFCTRYFLRWDRITRPSPGKVGLKLLLPLSCIPSKELCRSKSCEVVCGVACPYHRTNGISITRSEINRAIRGGG